MLWWSDGDEFSIIIIGYYLWDNNGVPLMGDWRVSLGIDSGTLTTVFALWDGICQYTVSLII